MSRSDDLAYFSRRFAEEMDRGDQAASASLAAIHYEMAHRYSLIVRASPGKPALTLIGGGKLGSAPDAFPESDAPLESGQNPVRLPLSNIS